MSLRIQKDNSALWLILCGGIQSTCLTLTAAAGIPWLIALVGIPSGYRTGGCWETG